MIYCIFNHHMWLNLSTMSHHSVPQLLAAPIHSYIINQIWPTNMAAFVMLDRTEFTYEKITSNGLTCYGLLTPYGEINLGQHWLAQWLVACLHQAISWSLIDLSLIGFYMELVWGLFHRKCLGYQYRKVWKIHFAKLLEYSSETTQWMGYFSCSYPYSIVVNLLWPSDNKWQH